MDKFALTANNVTYAAFGDAMHYWKFFPGPDDESGRVPVWGFADVADSRCNDTVRWRSNLRFSADVDRTDGDSGFSIA